MAQVRRICDQKGVGEGGHHDEKDDCHGKMVVGDSDEDYKRHTAAGCGSRHCGSSERWEEDNCSVDKVEKSEALLTHP